MAKIKTIALIGAETEVHVAGQNCDIRNDGTSIVYASTKEGITAGADGILSIPAGNAAKLLDTNGIVHLLGTGSVQLCGNDYSELVFKSAASASSGGGGEDPVARQAIDTHAGNGEIHLTVKEAIEAAATTISNPNLLINPNFKINQRNLKAYNIVGYTADMWKLIAFSSAASTGTVEITDNGVNLISNGNSLDIYFRQHLENGADLVGKTVTLSFKATNITGEWGIGQFAGTNPSITAVNANGIATVTFEWTEQTDYAIQLFNRTANAEISGLEWVKLELGSITTLFTPPDPAIELTKCQRYCQIRTIGNINPVDLRPSMYSITPTITSLSDGNYMYSAEL